MQFDGENDGRRTKRETTNNKRAKRDEPEIEIFETISASREKSESSIDELDFVWCGLASALNGWDTVGPTLWPPVRRHAIGRAAEARPAGWTGHGVADWPRVRPQPRSRTHTHTPTPGSIMDDFVRRNTHTPTHRVRGASIGPSRRCCCRRLVKIARCHCCCHGVFHSFLLRAEGGSLPTHTTSIDRRSADATTATADEKAAGIRAETKRCRKVRAMNSREANAHTHTHTRMRNRGRSSPGYRSLTFRRHCVRSWPPSFTFTRGRPSVTHRAIISFFLCGHRRHPTRPTPNRGTTTARTRWPGLKEAEPHSTSVYRV